jgi:hypothetical protein
MASSMVGVCRRSRLVNSENSGRADADDDGEHQHLDAGGDDVAQHALGHEGGLAEQAERDEHEAAERGQLELDQRDEELDRRG